MILGRLKLLYKLMAISLVALVGYGAIALGTEFYSSRLETAMQDYERADASATLIARVRADLLAVHSTLYRLVSFTAVGDSQDNLAAIGKELDRDIKQVRREIEELGNQDLAKDLEGYVQWVAQTKDMLAVDLATSAMFIVSAEDAFGNMLKATEAMREAVDRSHEESRAGFAGALDGLDMSLYAIIAVAGAACLVLGMLIGRSILVSVRKSVAYAKAVAGGELRVELDVDQKDEIGELADSLRTMVGTLKNRLGFAQGIQDGITAPCIVATPDGKIAHVNSQILDLIERSGSPGDFMGKQVGEFFYPDDPGRPTITGKCIDGRKSIQAETETVTTKGNIRFVRVDASPIFDLGGELIGAMAVLQDLTDIRTKQTQIEEQNTRIAQSAANAGQISDKLETMAEALAAHLRQANTGAETQRARAEETATAMEEMSATVLAVAKNAGNSAQGADESMQKAQEGMDLVDKVITAINEVSTNTESLKASMADLGRLSSNIGQVLEVISDIADQTNLLALNAAIEAARAGEAGRGFAVVADEVRKLAEKTMQATGEVNRAVSDIQNSARSNMEAMDLAAQSVARSTDLANTSGQSLRRIMDLVQSVAEQIREIATASEQQSAASEQINRAIMEIRSISQETSESMDESTRTVDSLHQLAGRLNEVMDDMEGDGGAAPMDMAKAAPAAASFSDQSLKDASPWGRAKAVGD